MYFYKLNKERTHLQDKSTTCNHPLKNTASQNDGCQDCRTVFCITRKRYTTNYRQDKLVDEHAFVKKVIKFGVVNSQQLAGLVRSHRRTQKVKLSVRYDIFLEGKAVRS